MDNIPTPDAHARQLRGIVERSYRTPVSTSCEVPDCFRGCESTRFESGARIEMCARHTGRVQRLVRETRKTPAEAAQLVRQGDQAGRVVTGP